MTGENAIDAYNDIAYSSSTVFDSSGVFGLSNNKDILPPNTWMTLTAILPIIMNLP